MASVEAARLLLAKARQDEYVLEQFADNRYEFFAEEVDKPLDRLAVLEQVRRLRAWVEARLDADEKPGHG